MRADLHWPSWINLFSCNALLYDFYPKEVEEGWTLKKKSKHKVALDGVWITSQCK